MFSRPDDLADADVARVLAQGWGLIDVVVEYDAVGYGSHHWRVDTGARRWFATVDDLDARHRTVDDTRQTTAERLTTALTTAAALHKSGLDFVIAPEPSRNGTITEQLGERYVIALYRHVEGQSHPWSAFPGPSERLAVLDRLVHIHNTTPDVCTGALYDDFVIPGRDELEMALHDPEMEWGPGPFADAARVLLAHHGRAVTAALEWYDGLVETVLSRSGPMVLTHGEPHRGNTIDTASGVVLIDWDTALLAPPERDLWILINEDPGIADAYTACTASPSTTARSTCTAGGGTFVRCPCSPPTSADRTGAALTPESHQSNSRDFSNQTGSFRSQSRSPGRREQSRPLSTLNKRAEFRFARATLERRNGASACGR